MCKFSLNVSHDFSLFNEFEDPGEHFYTSPIWLKYCELIYGYPPKVIEVREHASGRLIALLPVCKTKRFFVSRWHIPYGGKVHPDFYDKLFDIYNFVSRNLSSKLLGWPLSTLINTNPFHPLHSGFRHKWSERATAVVDLHKAPLILRKKRLRYLHRRGLKQGLYVRKIEKDVEELEKAHTIVAAMKKRMKAPVLPFSKWKRIFEEVDPSHTFIQHYLVYQDDKPVGFQGVLLWKSIAIEFGLADTPLARQQKLYVNDFVQFELIKMFYEKGLRYLDLAGYFLSPKAPKEKSLNHFKEKWATDILIYHQYNRSLFTIPDVINPFARRENI